MTGENTSDLIFYALLLILPISALVARRVRVGVALKMAGAWILIFGVGLVAVGQRDNLAALFNGTVGSSAGSDQSVVGHTVRIQMAPDGHFWGSVRLNGVRRRMLIDSGATITALSAKTAEAAGVDVKEEPFPAIVRTANGSVSADKAKVARVELGSIEARELSVVVSDAFGDVDVIGMNFLSRLKSWRVEGKTLILEPVKRT